METFQVGQKYDFDLGYCFVYSSTKANATFTINLEATQQYDIWVRALLNPRGGNMVISTASCDFPIGTKSPTLSGFKWVKAGQILLSEGTQQVLLSNVDGFNVINLIAVVPSAVVNKNIQDLTSSILNSNARVVYLTEGEMLQTDVPNSIQLCSGEASGGHVLQLSTNKASMNFFSLKNSSYTIAVKTVAGSEYSDLAVEIAGTKITIDTNSSTCDMDWHYGNIPNVPYGKNELIFYSKSLTIPFDKVPTSEDKDCVFTLQPLRDNQSTSVVWSIPYNEPGFKFMHYSLNQSVDLSHYRSVSFNLSADGSGREFMFFVGDKDGNWLKWSLPLFWNGTNTISFSLNSYTEQSAIAPDLGNVTELTFAVRVYENDLSQGQENTTLTINSIDIRGLVAIDEVLLYPNDLSLHSSNPLISEQPQLIEYAKKSPIEMSVKIAATNPFMLVCREEYHNLWSINTSGEHINLFSMNGFYINSTEPQVQIIFLPEISYEVGITLSTFSIISGFCFCLYTLIKGKLTIRLLRTVNQK
jgi:hypothetical protein